MIGARQVAAGVALLAWPLALASGCASSHMLAPGNCDASCEAGLLADARTGPGCRCGAGGKHGQDAGGTADGGLKTPMAVMGRFHPVPTRPVFGTAGVHVPQLPQVVPTREPAPLPQYDDGPVEQLPGHMPPGDMPPGEMPPGDLGPGPDDSDGPSRRPSSREGRRTSAVTRVGWWEALTR